MAGIDRRKTHLRILFESTLIVGSIAPAPATIAAASTATGTVKAVTAFEVTQPKGFKNPGLKAGGMIRIARQTIGKSMEADSITILK